MQVMYSSSGLTYDLYIKTPCAVLKLQVRNTPLKDFFLKSITNDVVAHTMNAELDMQLFLMLKQ